ncbi:MAG: hypothetical protein KGL39_06825 [Patescibacteria group bacterium]|nr:hypothetical protein [Patescibacteria group bacterium]
MTPHPHPELARLGAQKRRLLEAQDGLRGCRGDMADGDLEVLYAALAMLNRRVDEVQPQLDRLLNGQRGDDGGFSTRAFAHGGGD